MFGIGILAALCLLAWPLALLVLGVALAAAIAPIAGALERRLPRVVAIILVYLVFLLVIVGIGFIALPR